MQAQKEGRNRPNVDDQLPYNLKRDRPYLCKEYLKVCVNKYICVGVCKYIIIICRHPSSKFGFGGKTKWIKPN